MIMIMMMMYKQMTEKVARRNMRGSRGGAMYYKYDVHRSAAYKYTMISEDGNGMATPTPTYLKSISYLGWVGLRLEHSTFFLLWGVVYRRKMDNEVAV